MSNHESVSRFVKLSKAQIKAKKKYDETGKNKFLDLFNKLDEKLKKFNIELITELSCYRYVDKQDYDFLKNLNKKLCHYEIKKIYLDLKGDYFTVSDIHYKNYIISKNDFIKLEKIFRGTCMVFYPVKTNEFLTIGYELYDYKNKKVVLNFSENQLPWNINFNVLARFFNSKSNLKKIEKINVKVGEKGEYLVY